MMEVFTGWLKSPKKKKDKNLSAHRGGGDILTVLKY